MHQHKTGLRAIMHPEGDKKTVVVIPAFNEERFIASVVLKTHKYASLVIVVDDGSSDSTADLAEKAGATVIRQFSNGGKAKALNVGFQLALEFDPSVIVCLDADAQHDPNDIPTVIQPVLTGEADVVIGSRFLEIKNDIPQWRQVGQHTLTAVTNSLSGTKVTDSQSGFRAFSPTAARALSFKTDGLSVESEMQFLFEPAGLKVVEAPITVKYQDGNKRNPVIHGLNVLNSMLSLVARRRPLVFLSFPGAFIGSLGFLLGLVVIIRMQQTGTLLVGSAVLTALLVLTGLMLVVTGIMLHSFGHFISRLREEITDLLPSKPAHISTRGIAKDILQKTPQH